VVICLERGADHLHIVQLTPLHPKTPPYLASLPAGDVSHEPGGRLPLLSVRPAGLATLHISPHLSPDRFYVSGTGLPRMSRKRGR